MWISVFEQFLQCDLLKISTEIIFYFNEKMHLKILKLRKFYWNILSQSKYTWPIINCKNLSTLLYKTEMHKNVTLAPFLETLSHFILRSK